MCVASGRHEYFYLPRSGGFVLRMVKLEIQKLVPEYKPYLTTV